MHSCRAVSVSCPIIDRFGTPVFSDSTEKALTPEEFIVYSARVSNPENQSNTQTTTKLLNYLWRHKHFSPFEMVNVVMEVVTTRDIGRQILRHKSCNFQEFSQRYSDPTQFDFELREARLQDPKNRQNSLYPDVGSAASLNATWKHYQLKVQKSAKEAYDWAIANGIAKEQARVVLPEGMTVTKLYVNGSLRSWIHFIQVRNCPGPQKEVTRVAQTATDEVARLFPAMRGMLEEMVDETWAARA